MSLLELFCDVDNFCQRVATQHQRALPAHFGQKVRQPGLWPSEIMTILIHFHQSGYRCFKDYYQQVVLGQLHAEFPRAVSYARFVRLVPRVVLLLWAYAQSRCGRCTGSSFVDSTALKVCHNRRISRNRVCAGIAKRGQSSTGWFYGFKFST
jgi:hypothetical protein